MKQKLGVVFSLLATVIVFSALGLIPGEESITYTGEVVKYFPEYSFSPASYKECCTGENKEEVHSTRIQALLDAKLEGYAVDFALQEGSYFELESEDALYLGRQAIWFIRSDTKDIDTSYAKSYAVLSVPEERRSRTNIDPHNVVEDKPTSIRGVTIIADQVWDIDRFGHEGDWTRLVLPGVSSVTYSPMLAVGDVRRINGKEVELLRMRTSPNAWQLESGIAILRVDGVVGSVASFEPTTINGIEFTLNSVRSLSGEAVFYINDVFTVDL